MSIREVTMFTLDCDGCGQNADEGTDYAGWSDRETAVEMAREGFGFHEIDGKFYCPECVVLDEETDEWRLKLKGSP